MKKRRERHAARVRRAEQAQPSYVGRRRVLMVLMVLACATLVAGAYYQQILRKDDLQARADRKYLSPVKVPAHRGVITDRNGEILAVSTPVESVWADPRLFKPDAGQLKALAKILKTRASDLEKLLLRHSSKSFVFLARSLSHDEARGVVEKAEALGLDGIGLRREYRRYYPAGEVFAHIIGFAGRDDNGLEGVELLYDEQLRGVPGRKWVIRDARRRMIEDVENIESPKEGEDLVLSLDRRLQFLTYRALKTAVAKHKAKSASAVLLDARTGEVLAMANQPSYNPNGDRSKIGSRVRNRAVTDAYEPGSTMKPLTVAAALDARVIAVDDVIDTGPGQMRVGRNRVRDHHPLGVIDLATLLRKSSNVGAAKVAMAMPREQFWGYLSRLGFGTAAGVGFPGEAVGRLSHPDTWANIDHATLSFGYSLSMSTLQLARAYAVLAADGLRRPVSLLKVDTPPPAERVFSAEVARAVRTMLESVVSAEGTAPKAAVPGYRVSGKTGTVKKLGPDGYKGKIYRSLFAGMAPASDPRLVLVVMVDEPRGKSYYGGSVAGPVFSEIVTQALRLLNVPPDEPGMVSEMRLAVAGGDQ
jgi:cell division protein FtsI (penicillin-binding protein 3)